MIYDPMRQAYQMQLKSRHASPDAGDASPKIRVIRRPEAGPIAVYPNESNTEARI